MFKKVYLCIGVIWILYIVISGIFDGTWNDLEQALNEEEDKTARIIIAIGFTLYLIKTFVVKAFTWPIDIPVCCYMDSVKKKNKNN